ncbi:MULTISPECIES: L-threonylcarbamoyladenylate synthase [Ensifer]|jgi:L-threonylcarbamoyladenylate synthase|uniref:L-threonylcarbamoyladenylate synthase n=1 Tax=Ensifer TaxID=106591 RepID=UPI0007145FC0|nr:MULTISPECIES: L-threonylcarbamoyladenylate synthase [Ensifer]KQX51344.1 translation factor Sua5 [Ensifer sp. Root1298]KQX83709.1 translation factor Sua5 [Ensifer sp. Root1312]KRC20054.1 translation factor Sua5 [Ensifer sp. Root74]KRD63301.1 translation factor Sua5 [Ensifer sp. Root954]
MIMEVATNPRRAVSAGVEALCKGEVIAIPTETVYGLAADATNESAVARVFEVKRRPSFNPLICHCSDMEMVSIYADLDPVSLRLAEAFWPGPMTLVLQANPSCGLPSRTTAGLSTVAIRIPAGFSRDLIRSFGKPLAAPSANISGKVSATTAQHVRDDFGDEVPLILDGGPTKIGVESTILAVGNGGIELLRPGGLPVELIERVAGLPITFREVPGRVVAPGMLTSHYAPRASVRLDAMEAMKGEVLLKVGGAFVPGEGDCARVFDLSPNGSLEEVAVNLYATLKAADELGVSTIAVVPIPDCGLGLALNDRLRRAAAPRSLTPEEAALGGSKSA